MKRFVNWYGLYDIENKLESVHYDKSILLEKAQFINEQLKVTTKKRYKVFRVFIKAKSDKGRRV